MGKRLGETIYFGAATHSPSGGFAKGADELPRFWVYEENNDTPLIAFSGMTLRANTINRYRGEFVASAGLGFESQKSYHVWVSGLVEGINGQLLAKDFFLENNNFDSLGTGNIPVNVEYLRATRASGTNGIFQSDIRLLNGVAVSGVDVITASGNTVYYADVRFHKDNSNSRDEWTSTWFRNDSPLPSAEVITPVLHVIGVTTGSDLIASSGMAHVSISIGTVKYYENTNRTTAGENYIAKVTASIDGATRTWQKLVGRDS